MGFFIFKVILQILGEKIIQKTKKHVDYIPYCYSKIYLLLVMQEIRISWNLLNLR